MGGFLICESHGVGGNIGVMNNGCKGEEVNGGILKTKADISKDSDGHIEPEKVLKHRRLRYKY